MTKETDSFSNEMLRQGVKPLSDRHDRALSTLSTWRDLNGERRRAAAVSETPSDVSLGFNEQIQSFGPHDLIEFRRVGVQLDVFKALKRTRGNEFAACLDLHRMRVDEARAALLRFINDANNQGIRYVLVLHGKGLHTRPDEKEEQRIKVSSRLKSYVVHWLKSMETVQAFSSAKPQDGGTGALYILLKNEKNVRGNSG